MELSINSNQRKLLDALLCIPPDFAAATSLLNAISYTAEEITKVAIRYADDCQFNVGDHLSENTDERVILNKVSFPTDLVPGLHSTYLYDIIEFLLPHGINANAVFETENSRHNLMDSLFFVDNEYVAADTLKLLLDNGGDPNLVVDGETIYDQAAFEVWLGSVEQSIRRRYDSWVHMWFVLLAYGGKPQDKESALQVFREYDQDTVFDHKKLREHRNYYYGLTIENGERYVHIYDKNTLWEVARW